MDYSWVDNGLKKLGLALDLSPSEVPLVTRPPRGQTLTVNHIVNTGKALFTAPLLGAVTRSSNKDNDGNGPSWTAEVGLFEGGSVVTDKTVLSNFSGLSRDDWAKLVVDDSMTEIAQLWDETFVEGRFTHVILRDGRVFENDGKVSIAGVRATDVAKIMRWIFAAPGVAKRDIVSVYVTCADEQSIETWYLPIKGPSVAVRTPNCVRGRLMIPCLDRGIFGQDGSIAIFEHFATARLEGWIPVFLQNSAVAKKKFLEGSAEEAGHFLKLFRDARDPSSKFTQIPRRDGTVLS